MTCQSQDLTIIQGATFEQIVRWETLPLIYKPITAITQAGPVQITATAHGCPDGWRAAVVSAGGMRQINATHWPLTDVDFHKVTVNDSANITFNDTNSGSYTAYTTGGSLVFYTPTTLTGFTAALTVVASQGSSAALGTYTSGAPDNSIVIDTANFLSTITLPSSVTQLLPTTWGTTSAWYYLEFTDGSGNVTQLLSGNITVVGA